VSNDIHDIPLADVDDAAHCQEYDFNTLEILDALYAER
jgi:hypothetical protein